jgi:hypothetical protein
MPDTKKVEISNIFNWYKNDFDKAGRVTKILAQYAPQQYRDFLASGNFETTYLPATGASTIKVIKARIRLDPKPVGFDP